MADTVTAEQVEQVVVDFLAEIGPERELIKRDATLEELDIDSLDLAELSQVVEEKFGVRIKGDDVASIKTVGQAIDLVASRAE